MIVRRLGRPPERQTLHQWDFIFQDLIAINYCSQTMKLLSNLKLLVLNLAILASTNAGSLTTSKKNDVIATLALANSPALTRVTKYVSLDYPVALVPGRVWAQLPDCSMLIDLQHPQEVSIRYNVQLWGPSEGLLITHVLIDGKEHKNLRVASGSVKHLSNWSMDSVWLEKGQHEIKVMYNLSVAWPYVMTHEFNVVNFKVTYFELSQ